MTLQQIYFVTFNIYITFYCLVSNFEIFSSGAHYGIQKCGQFGQCGSPDHYLGVFKCQRAVANPITIGNQFKVAAILNI